MIKPHMVKEENPLGHCMPLRRATYGMKMMKNFLGNPQLKH